MQDLFAVQYSYLIPLLPLVGAAIAGFFGARWLRGASHWPIWIGVGASAVLSIMLLVGMIGLQSHDGHDEAGHEGGHGDIAAVEEAPEAHAQGYPLAHTKRIYQWIGAGDSDQPGTKNYLDVAAGFLFDPLTAVMLCVVCGIGFLITVFAAGYMKGEEGYFRFFAYLGLFIFAMTILVMGDNLIMLYLGWEGVGVCSYLLIGYYYDKPAAREAAKKAFLVNRIGDFGFALGIMLCFYAFGTISYFGEGAGTNTGLLELAAGSGHWALAYIPFLLMLGAFGKSAQFPLHVWLPDAMEGPTPVSALIHAATMVTAGVYMIARCSTLFFGNEAALATVAIIGCFTAIFAASIALRQFDLKKIFAYSTVSQLGFMFVGVACLAPVAGVFHLVTHAFFKALLFLSSGVVMHAMMGELDLRKMSGLKRVLPWTRWLMLIGCLALAGMVPFSGFWSKDEILVAAFHYNFVIGLVLLITAFLTAYYSFRLYFRVFEGPQVIPSAPADMTDAHGHGTGGHGHASTPAVQTGTTHESGVDEQLAHDPHHHPPAHHADHGHHNHEPAVMIIPLVVLALGAIFAGLINLPFNIGVPHALGSFLGQSPSFAMGLGVAERTFGAGGFDPIAFGAHVEGEVHLVAMIVSVFVAGAGIFLAYVLHLKNRAAADRLAVRMAGTSRLLEAKYWVDEIYQGGIVEPLRRLGRGFAWLDRIVVDGLFNWMAMVPEIGGGLLRVVTQRGFLQGYAALMILCIAAILLIVFW